MTSILSKFGTSRLGIWLIGAGAFVGMLALAFVRGWTAKGDADAARRLRSYQRARRNMDKGLSHEAEQMDDAAFFGAAAERLRN